MRGYLKSQPDPTMRSVIAWGEMVKAKTKAEKTDVFVRNQVRETQQSGQEKTDLEARFGGQVRYVIAEYQRRGAFNDMEARKLEFETRSLAFLGSAASTLEALARRL
jgi:hypothetical protein